MNKAFKSLVDDRTDVSVDTGLRAAEKLQSVLDGRDQGIDIAEMKAQLGRIIYAVKSTVPQQMWGEIAERLDHPDRHPEALDVEADAFDDADERFDPTEFAEDDEF